MCCHPTNEFDVRLDRVGSQVSAQADLLRTSLTVQQQAQSTKELEALQANSKTQLLLQESVEGLSVVAITYYTVGVAGCAHAAARTNARGDERCWTRVCAPACLVLTSLPFEALRTVST